jgi:hypothetical protein
VRPLALLAAVFALQAASVVPQESRLDLQHIISDDTALGSVELLYSVEGQLVALHGDGRVLMQSTNKQLSLLPTCKGKVAPADIRRLVETMLAAQFLDLPQKSYMMINPDAEDWRKLQLHSISIKATGGSAKRGFAAGEYGGEHQELPEKFATVEKAIVELKSKTIPPGTHCTVAPPLWSEDKSVPTVR